MNIHHSDLAKHFGATMPRPYAKTGTVRARLALEGEKIDTILDGKLETTNTAKPFDVVVIGPKNEEYLVPQNTFIPRYKGPALTHELQSYEAQGIVFAIPWDQDPLTFVAPWGEEMIIEPGDYLASTTRDGDAPYRIEREAFSLTYRPL